MTSSKKLWIWGTTSRPKRIKRYWKYCKRSSLNWVNIRILRFDFQTSKKHILGDLCKNGKDHPYSVTVYKAILSHATNGDKLISTILDQSVQRAGDANPNSADSYLNINFARLISSRKPNVQVIKDMIDLKTPATRALLTHPVIETYLSIKWRKWKKLFLVQFLIYLLFLIVYSAFLGKCVFHFHFLYY